MRSRWRVGVDTGGTFTDLVAVDGVDLRTSKVPSTPTNYAIGVIDAIHAAGLEVSEISMIAHGTTVATNAILTRGGSPTALITTDGFRDVLELRRHNRGEMYDIMWDPPEPLVPRRHRFEVRERVDYTGAVMTELCEEDVVRAVEHASRAAISSFAICFLHSYANPTHEQRAAEIVRSLQPTSHVYTSAALLREPNEFERTSTVVVNAYVGPVVADYLQALSEMLDAAAFAGRLYVMHSGGGLLTAETAVAMPARLLTSGPAGGAMAAEGLAASGSPAAGVVAATVVADEAAHADVISLDIGGTSADIAVIRNGEARLVYEYSVEFGSPIRFPTIDLTVIGAGGGSIASVDAGGLPTVGPQSAGAVPGPAAYRRGGTVATVTDAHVVLGRLAPETPLAGGTMLDVDLARAAVAEFAASLNLLVEEAALGIIAIANANMARAIRLATVERGLDPRQFALVPFGGAGSLHGAEIAELLDISTVIIPVAPGVTSALGCLYVDIVHDAVRSLIHLVSSIERVTLEEAIDELTRTVHAFLDTDQVPTESRRFETYLDLRYVGQVRGVSIRLPSDDATDEAFRESVTAGFWAEYNAQFGYAPVDIPVEIASVRVRGTGLLERPMLPNPRGDTSGGKPLHIRDVVTTQGPNRVPVYSRDGVSSSNIAGPAIIAQNDATTWLPEGWICRLQPGGHLRLERVEAQ